MPSGSEQIGLIQLRLKPPALTFSNVTTPSSLGWSGDMGQPPQLAYYCRYLMMNVILERCVTRDR